MKRLTHEKIAAVVVTTALTVGGGGIAFAYFTSSGSGTGSAQTGSGGSVTITGDSYDGSPLVPGGSPQNLGFHLQNDSSSDPVHVGTVYSDVSPVGLPQGCQASWYVLSGPVTVDQSIAPAESVDVSAQGASLTIGMPADDVVDQSACIDAQVTIDYSTSDPVG